MKILDSFFKVFWKIVDRILKVLNTDRNTFITYVLTLITIYLVIDRIVEMLFMIFTGISVDYWGPIAYTFALACPFLAFQFSGASKFVKNHQTKLYLFYLYCISLFIIGISMLSQWINYLGWLGLVSLPNYSFIATNLYDIIGPAFKSIAIYIPVVTVPMLFNFIYVIVHDTKKFRESIIDYKGINLADNSAGTGPYTCEIALCKDNATGKTVKIPENRRYEVSLIVGVSGSGKTTMVVEPMIARDIEKKFFFRTVAKELAHTALKNNLATLNCPYTNEYINANFSMSMLTPNPYKLDVYKKYMKDLILDSNGENITYKNLGITFLAPDVESLSHVEAVAKNYNMKYNIIDPNNNTTAIGLNPFVHENPTKTAIIISSVIRGMYKTIDVDSDELIKENVAIQAVENISILLKEMYPRLHDGLLPNLEDMLKMLNNFDLVEDMCIQLEADEQLAEQYAVQLCYFKRHFYRNASGRAEMEKNVVLAVTQLDTLLRYQGVKNILCNRSNNVNFEKALANGEITLICTQRGDLGEAAHKAFGLFSILLLQQSVLTRPGNERNRIPHFLYIDEFASFVCEATTPIFTIYRKYRVGPVITAQNIGQFNVGDNENCKKTILANSTTKMVFGNNTPEDNQWWQNEFGTKREWEVDAAYDAKNSEYESKKTAKYVWKDYAKAGKIQTMKFKACMYKTKDIKGVSKIGAGSVDFLESKYKEQHHEKFYEFSKYHHGISSDTADDDKKTKFNYKSVSFDTEDEVDPIQTDIGGSLFDNADAISFNFGPKKSE